MEEHMIKQSKRNLRQDILDVAADMLNIYGYDGTTFQKIADTLGITKGAITYHFKNKYVIMDILFEEFFQHIRSHIDRFPEAYRNTYWRFCTMYIYAYRVIMSSPNNIALFYHKDQMSQWEQSKIKMVHDIYNAIKEDFHKVFTDEDLMVMSYIDLGARRRLYLERENGSEILQDIDRYIRYHIELIGVLAHLDSEIIQENVQKAFDFVNSHELPTGNTIFSENKHSESVLDQDSEKE